MSQPASQPARQPASHSVSTCQLQHLLWQLQQAAAGQLQPAQAARHRWQLLRQLQAVDSVVTGLPTDVQLMQRQPAGMGHG